MKTKILLLTTPFTQINTPYPATAWFKGFFEQQNIKTHQADLSLEVFLKIFSSDGLKNIFDNKNFIKNKLSKNSERIYSIRNQYINTIDTVIGFLQNNNQTFARSIVAGQFIPKASRFENEYDLEAFFGNMGIHDKARHLATLYLEDLADFITEAIDLNFGFSRYAKSIAQFAPNFDMIESKINDNNSFIDNIMLDLLSKKIELYNPQIIAITIPFPGNLCSALKCGQWIKNNHPEIAIAIGGGYINTELLQMTDNRIYNYVDYVANCGLTNSINWFFDKLNIQNTEIIDEYIPFDYSDLMHEKYISVIELTNPMHCLWSDGKWNKIMLANGCYWAKCTFCDTSLDYIKKYSPFDVKLICDNIELIIQQTGQTGFHFVDEAAPPKLLRDLAIEILNRKIKFTWWTNIRFEKSFSDDLCRLLHHAGCIAVSGGLEVANDAILKKINKGVTLQQVIGALDNLTNNGIMVHAYLMYGFPSQTMQDTIDSLEIVRQFFDANLIQSGFWHKFALTTHSIVAQKPDMFGIKILQNIPNSFANNEIPFEDNTRVNHSIFADGLRKAIYNFTHQNGIDFPLQSWFEFKIANTTVKDNFVSKILENNIIRTLRETQRVVWIGNDIQIDYLSKSKKNKTIQTAQLTINTIDETLQLNFTYKTGKWLYKLLNKLNSNMCLAYTVGDFINDYENDCNEKFELLINSNNFEKIKRAGLLFV